MEARARGPYFAQVPQRSGQLSIGKLTFQPRSSTQTYNQEPNNIQQTDTKPTFSRSCCQLEAEQRAMQALHAHGWQKAHSMALPLIESNQAYGSMVSCFFWQSDCSLARLVHVCLLQSLWWTSAVSRRSALRPNVVNPFFVFCGLSQFWMRGKKGGEMLSKGLAPWSLSGAISGRSLWQENLVSFYLTSLFDACCEGWGFETIVEVLSSRP